MITSLKPEYPVSLLCGVFDISRSVYYSRRKIKNNDAALNRKAVEIFRRSRRSYGQRRMSEALRPEGYMPGRRRVRKLMEKLKLRVRSRKKYVVTTVSGPGKPTL